MVAGRSSSPDASLPALAGREVVVAGRLSALSRTEAFERIAASDARLVERPSARTAWVVLPGGALPLGEDGALSATLDDARRRIEAGQALEILDEDEFLRRLGLTAETEPERRLYTTAQLARILELPARRLTAWVRAGLLRPARVERRLARFEFREVSQARTLARLIASGVTPRRLRSSLEALSRWWPGARTSLARLEAFEDSGCLVVRTPSGDIADPSGQLRLDFAGRADPAEVRDREAEAPLSSSVLPGSVLPGSADSWFLRAQRHEEEDRLEEAARAYSHALDPGRPRPEAAFNLGNVLFTLERVQDASAAFALAVELDPEYVEAWNNLGNALSLLEQHEQARGAFERALALDPGYADAHFNLAETLAANHDLEGARTHWRAYLEHDPDSAWSAEVRARLRRTDPAGARLLPLQKRPIEKGPPRPEVPDEGGLVT